MKKYFVRVSVTLLIVFTILAVGYYAFMYVFMSSFKTECKKLRQWKIGDYTVIEKKCLGWAGPHYYPLYLYNKNGKKISEGGHKLDSCIFKFDLSEDNYLKLDICNNEIMDSKLKN